MHNIFEYLLISFKFSTSYWFIKTFEYKYKFQTKKHTWVSTFLNKLVWHLMGKLYVIYLVVNDFKTTLHPTNNRVIKDLFTSRTKYSLTQINVVIICNKWTIKISVLKTTLSMDPNTILVVLNLSVIKFKALKWTF